MKILGISKRFLFFFNFKLIFKIFMKFFKIFDLILKNVKIFKIFGMLLRINVFFFKFKLISSNSRYF